MRLTSSLTIAATALAILAGCGTKTPLTLPPQPPQKASLAPTVFASPARPADGPSESPR